MVKWKSGPVKLNFFILTLVEEIITSLDSIKIIIIIITWVTLGRKSRERIVFPLFGWLEERRKQGI